MSKNTGQFRSQYYLIDKKKFVQLITSDVDPSLMRPHTPSAVSLIRYRSYVSKLRDRSYVP